MTRARTPPSPTDQGALAIRRAFDTYQRRFHAITHRARQRFLARIDEPDKNWKFSAGDVKERANWDAYQAAFADVLSRSSTAAAPWHVIPADNKWFARLAAAGIIADALIDMDPQFPEVSGEAREALLAARVELLAEDPGTGSEAAGPSGAGAGDGKGRKGSSKRGKGRRKGK